MRVNHIKGPAGSGKSTMLQAVMKQQGARNCLLIGGHSTTKGVIQALERRPNVTTLLIDDFDGRRINLKKIAQHERACQLVVHVAHTATGAA